MKKVAENFFKNAICDHVAIAVDNLEKAKKIYQLLGFQFDPVEEVVEDQGVKTAFASIDQNTHLELLLPIDQNSPVAKFMQKRGAGIHHICFKVKDIAKTSEVLVQNGLRLIYAAPKEGARGCLVNFIHPESAGGVLIEISQPKGD